MYSSYAAADTQRGHSRTPSRSRSPSRGRSHSRSRSRSRSSSSSGGRSNNSHHRKSSRHRRHSRSRSTSRSGSRSRSASASASSRSSRSHSRSPRRRSRKSRSHSRSRSRSHSPRSGSDDEGEYKYDPNGPHPLAHLYTHSSIHISAAQFLPRAAGPSREPGGYWRDKERAKQQNNNSGFAPPRDYFQAQQRGRGGGGYYSREGPAPPPPGYGWPPPNPYGMPPLPFGAPPHMPFPYGHPGAMPAMMGAGVPPVAAAVGLPPPPPHHGHHHHHHLHHHNAPQQQQQYSNNSRTNPFAAPGGIGRPSLLVNVEHDVAIELAIPLGPLIEREFIFKREASAHIPRVEDLFHESIQHDQRLQSMKDELNGVKSHLDTLDLKSWGKHTDFTNVCSRIAPAVRTAASPEMCTGAFIKMYEMLKSYEIIPNAVKKGNQSQVNTVHLCEAPGGFISATNHYLRNEVSADTNWNWKAVSLNPYHEGNDLGAMIDDDRMMLETKSHWMFGRDNTGDIREIENIRDFWKVAREMGPIHAVTADGSISCADEPNEQESHTAQLHYCEMVCALGLLAKGGSIVLKTFTFFEHTSLNMLYLLHTLFDSLIISKPACSKAGNSETYIVAVGFQGIDPELLETLLSFCGSSKPKTMMLSRDFIGANFIRQATVMAEFFSRCSAAIIERNLSLFNNMDRHARGATEALKTAVANEFIRRFNFRPLPVGCYRMFGSGPSLDGSKLQLGRSVQQGRENRGGSLLDRQSHKRKAEESKEELGIVSVATKHTLGGVKEEEEEGEDSAENESAADGQQPPTKKAKRGGIGSDATMMETSAEGGESSGSSSTMLSTVDSVFDSTPAAPTSIDPTLYSTAAQRMMAKMGYKPGQGLGAKEQGIAQPIQASTQVGQQGLGFMNAEEFVRFLQAPSAFTNTSSSSSDGSSSSSNFVLPMTDNEVRFSPRVQEWLIEGRVPKLLSLSKFCDTEILKSMAEIRSSLLMPANRGTFLSSNFSHRNFPTYFLGGAKSIFSNPVALEIAELDLLFEISSKLKQSFAANGETLRVFEMHTAFEAAQVGKGFGATEYFSKKFDQENVKVAFEILPSFLDPASPSAASSSSSSSAASIPSLSIPTTTSSTVDVLLDSNESVVAAAGSTFPLSADKIVLLHAQQASNLIDVENKSHLVLAHAQRVFSFESSSLNWNVVENYISLTQLLSCLSHLELGGVLLLRTTDLLSRFSAGLLYTLDLLFNNVAVLKTATMAPAEPEKWIYAAGFSGLPTPLKEYMQKIEKNYKDMLAAGTLDFHHPSCLCLLEFIPMDLLLQRYYWSYLLETNDRLVGAEVKDGRRALATIVDKKDEAVESSDNATKRTRIGKEVREKLTTWLTGKVPEYV